MFNSQRSILNLEYSIFNSLLHTFVTIMIRKRSLRRELLAVMKSLRDAVSLFRKNDPLRMAAATAFFCTFALPPIIFILAQLFGLFIDRQIIGRGLLERISNILGTEGAGQVRQVIRSIRGFSNTWYVIVFGFIFLVFVATTLFTVIKKLFKSDLVDWRQGTPGSAFQIEHANEILCSDHPHRHFVLCRLGLR